MIRVTIEMLPRGDETKKYHMGTIDIANDGTGTAERGNYKVKLAGFKSPHSRWREGAVRDFPRKSRGPYDLLLRALATTVGDRAKRLVADLEADWWAGREAATDQDLSPWPDFAGNPIRHGARMWHPISGQTFTAVRLSGYSDPGDAWRAIYDDEPQSVSRLVLQIGDKGQAVIVTP